MATISPETLGDRIIHLNSHAQNNSFCNNAVKTSKYTKTNFLFKNLYEQFRRISNIYFLIISILQLSTDLSPTNPYSTITPLIFVLLLSMFKEGVEDLARYKADASVNNYTAEVVDGSNLVKRKWKDIHVGDMIKIYDKEHVPADIVVLSTSELQHKCYIETSNLDGENNLKLKQALSLTSSLTTPQQLSVIKGYARCEAPNSRLYNFSGSFSMEGNQISAITVNNVILRGAVIRNTVWLYGIVVYTGPDTKLMKNSKSAPSKRSNIDLVVNKAVLLIFGALAVMCSISAILNAISINTTDHSSYLVFLQEESRLRKALSWITFLILFNNLVPISLYITLELVKWCQARIINHDEKMVYNDTPAIARTSNLNEDLGQIHYIFSDKTGTLTQNEMRFRKCSIGGVRYGDYIPKPDEIARPAVHEEHEMFNFIDPRLLEDLQNGKNAQLSDFLLCLALCHTVIPEFDGETLSYRAASPDEGALVTAARCFGYKFENQYGDQSESHVTLNIFGVKQSFHILSVNSFTSTRKRMSVIVRTSQNRLILLCKGADSVMNPRLAESVEQDLIHSLNSDIKLFASEGLRTLMLAKKELDEAVFEDWRERHISAQNFIQDREAELQAIAEEIETDMVPLGCTAIEDKLQDGVPDTISALGDAGIRIWMLTGDKEETAINIAYSCKLLHRRMHKMVINGSTKEACVGQLHGCKNSLCDKQMWDPSRESPNLALIIEGSSLVHLLPQDPLCETSEERDVKLQLLELAQQCRAVIACRVSPLQKSQVVSLVKNNVKPEPVTLAIGDGANDVSMIQEAHVGIGISGNEGMQAVRSSDYSIAQFRFLQQLLLVHGRLSYQRVSKVIFYSFYKNIALIFTLFFYCFYNGFSGTTLYESYIQTGWNVGWTFFPIIAVGVLDKDILDSSALLFPHVYQSGQQNADFNLKRMGLWLIFALMHSTIVFFAGVGIFQNKINSSNGLNDGLFTVGTIVNLCLVLTVNFKISLETRCWTYWNIFFIVGSIALWFIFVFFYSSMLAVTGSVMFWSFSGIASDVFGRVSPWLTFPLISFASLTPDICYEYWRRTYRPIPADIVRELEYQDKRGHISIDQVKEEFKRDHDDALSDGATDDTMDEFDQEWERRHDSTTTSLIEQIKRAPAGKKVSILSLKKPIQRQNTDSIDMGSTTIHKITLEFIGRMDLEHEFNREFIRKGVSLLKRVLTICIGLGIIYSFIGVVSDDVQASTIAFRFIFTLIVMPAMRAFCSHPAFANHYHFFTTAGLLFAGIAKTLVIDYRGRFGPAFFVLFVFFVMRVRFINALLITLFDIFFYVLYVIVNRKENNNLDPERDIHIFSIFVMTVINYAYINSFHQQLLNIVSIVFSAYGGYVSQFAYRKSFLQQRKLDVQQHRTNEILHNIYPPHVSKQLQLDDQKTIADVEPSISILFCDVIDVTNFMDRLSPVQLVKLLDNIYSLYDEICLRHGVHKMETVGKTYMACAGLQNENKNHAVSCIQMGLDMLHLTSRLQLDNGDPINIRIGIHTGMVLSGLVGVKKRQFSLFGDTVNMASRMQSTGEPGRIHVSEETYSRVCHVFDFEQQTTYVKGRGSAPTYLLITEENQRITANFRTSESDKTDNEIRAQERVNSNKQRTTRLSIGDIDSQNSQKEGEEVHQIGLNMSPLLLKFADLSVEDRFIEYNEPRQIQGIRNTMFFQVIFLLFVLILRISQESNSFEVRHAMVLVFVFWCGVIASWTYLPFCSIRSKFFSPIVVIGFIGTGIITALIMKERQEEEDRLVDQSLDPVSSIIEWRVLFGILFMSLVANGGSLSWIIASCINTFVAVFQLIMVAISGTTDPYVYISMPFFIISSVAVNTMAVRFREEFQRRTFELEEMTVKQTHRASALLYDMIPREVVDKLAREQELADDFACVSMLFSDIEGFTTMAHECDPGEVVQVLHRLFTHFDRLTEQHEVFKIQTIGDAYVVASGIPYVDKGVKPDTPFIHRRASDFVSRNTTIRSRSVKAAAISPDGHSGPERFVTDSNHPDPRSHTTKLLAMAVDMIQVVEKVQHPRTKRPIRMRIGIHTGKITAGVIGTTKLRYDIWGSDVLIANQMESNGVPGYILVSEATQRLMRDDNRFKFHFHQHIEVRGKKIKTYIVQDVWNENFELPSKESKKALIAPTSPVPTNPSNENENHTD